MREIKFRAWDKTINKMRDVKVLDFNIGELCGISDGIYPYTHLNDVELMQFTGLKDKDGKEIYEGDILESEMEIIKQKWPKYESTSTKLIQKVISVVEYIRGGFVLQIDILRSVRMPDLIINPRTGLIDCSISFECATTYPDRRYEKFYGFKVIGNRFENPELLKED